METTNCTYSGDFQKPLTLDSIKKAIEVCKEYKDLYQEYAESKGFDLDKDMMFIPETFMLEYNLRSRENVVFSPHIEDQIVFIRGAGRKSNLSIKSDPEKPTSDKFGILPYPLPFRY